MALKERTGVQLYGVNYKDQAAAARRFLGRYGNPFMAVGVDANGRAAIEWGVYGMPETFIVNGKGEIVYKHVGPISRRDAGTQDHSRQSARPQRVDQDGAGCEMSSRSSSPRSRTAASPPARRAEAAPPAPGPANASMPMNRLMVKPMPPRMATPKSCGHVAPSGLPAQTADHREPGGSEDADRLADEQPERDAQAGSAPAACASDSPCERNAGVGEGEQRQHAEGHPRVQALLQLLQHACGSPAPRPPAEWRARRRRRPASRARPTSARTPR